MNSDNPFTSKPTIIDEVKQDDEEDESDSMTPTKVQEDYDEIPNDDPDVHDDEGKAEGERAQTPTELYGTLDQDKFWWVFVTFEDKFVATSHSQREIPIVQERFSSYEELADARENTDEHVPEGIHVQLKSSKMIRYVKGQDERDLLERRGLA